MEPPDPGVPSGRVVVKKASLPFRLSIHRVPVIITRICLHSVTGGVNLMFVCICFD